MGLIVAYFFHLDIALILFHRSLVFTGDYLLSCGGSGNRHNLKYKFTHRARDINLQSFEDSSKFLEIINLWFILILEK
jgi:hypothetical protein